MCDYFVHAFPPILLSDFDPKSFDFLRVLYIVGILAPLFVAYAEKVMAPKTLGIS